ncbi:MAG: DUF2007 domain-containing protein [Pseudomonadota bacterium]|nr:DUF2007 domain-containing protein [Pseudomonadota bacterium]
MKELFRSNDAVLLSFVDSLLTEAGIPHVIADQNMSIVEGSIGVLPRRMMVETARWEQAMRLLREADLGDIAPQQQ